MFAVVVVFSAVMATAQEQHGRFRGTLTDVQSKYEALQALSVRDVKDAFTQLTPQVRGDIWTLHLLRVIGDHPELTHEQRGVLFEALGLIASGAFEMDASDPEWTTRVREPLQQIEKRAALLLPADLVRVALYGLTRDAAQTRVGPGRFGIRTNETCHCQIGGTDCYPSVACERNFPRCTLTIGCGPMYLDGCNGLCQFP